MTNSEILESVFSLIFEPLEALTKLEKKLNSMEGRFDSVFQYWQLGLLIMPRIGCYIGLTG
jgi:hypothetical protein